MEALNDRTGNIGRGMLRGLGVYLVGVAGTDAVY